MSRWPILALVALAFASLTPVAASATFDPPSLCEPLGQWIGIGNDAVAFHGVEYDFPASGQSTWYYKVKSGSSPAISHVDFELNLDCIDVVGAGTWGPDKDDLQPGGGQPEIGSDPTTGITGVKFDQGFAGGEWRKYYFVLDRNLEVDDDGIRVATKAGPGFDIGRVCGPEVECDDHPTCTETPATNTPTPTFSRTATKTPSVTKTATATKSPSATKTPTPRSTATPSATPTPVCGDGIVAAPEQCDPGTDVATDCCTANCLFAAPGDACVADDEPCTVDRCDAAGSCRVVGNDDGRICDDGDLCTGPDVCVAGACSGRPIDCSDGYDCTRDSCHPVQGCLNVGIVESRDCPGTCTDGLNNDPTDPDDPLYDPSTPDQDDDVDYDDTGCATLAELARFGVVATRDKMNSDLKLGTNTSVASTEVDGTCDLTSNTCACPSTACEPFVVCTSDADCGSGVCDAGSNMCQCEIACPVADLPCQGDNDCLFEIGGSCDTEANRCQCPAFAPNCQARNRLCFDDGDCGVAGYPAGASIGGVCGNGMQISAGSKMGLLASLTQIKKVQFGTAESGDGERLLEIQREFANAGGTIQLGNPAPFVGPLVCSESPDVLCSDDSQCAPGTCSARRRLLDGNPFESFDGLPGAGMAGSGTSEQFKRCDVAVTQLRSPGGNAASALQGAIEDYVPAPDEVVTLGPDNCLECPEVDSIDAACKPCDEGKSALATKATVQKLVLTFDGGLQVLDVRRVGLAGKTVLVLRGEADTELLVRLQRSLRNGTESKVILEGMQADQVLWVAMGRFGGTPRISGASTWRGSILASERGSGIFLGAGSYTEGGIYGKRILVKGPNTTIQHMPWKGKLPSVP